MSSNPHPKLHTFLLILGATGLLALLPGCPAPPPPECTVDADCDDGDECTTDTCGVDTGECSNDALICDDEDLCTTDTCETESGCVFTEIVCDEGEVCVAGVCILVCTDADDCDDDDECTMDSCDVDTGECSYDALVCDDEDDCTVDTCDTELGCVFRDIVCDEDELCVAGLCMPVCTSTDDCDDDNACTTDTCGSDSVCVFTDIVCDEDEVCVEGECIKTCTSANDCDDEEFCNGTETCIDGLCQAGTFPCVAGEMCLEGTVECVPLGLVFSEDFEGGLGYWSADNGIWQVGVPSSGPGSAPSGEQLAATMLAENYPQNVSRFVSPSIDLPAIRAEDEIGLRFSHWFALARSIQYGFASHWYHYDTGVVQVRERTASREWSKWTSLASYSESSGDAFTQPLVDLSDYAGKEVQIGFLLNGNIASGSDEGWYVDDITIEAF